MIGDPILARRDKRTLPFGCALGLPTNCQLGENCKPATGSIAGVRMCQMHRQRVWKIARKAAAHAA